MTKILLENEENLKYNLHELGLLESHSETNKISKSKQLWYIFSWPPEAHSSSEKKLNHEKVYAGMNILAICEISSFDKISEHHFKNLIYLLISWLLSNNKESTRCNQVVPNWKYYYCCPEHYGISSLPLPQDSRVPIDLIRSIDFFNLNEIFCRYVSRSYWNRELPHVIKNRNGATQIADMPRQKAWNACILVCIVPHRTSLFPRYKHWKLENWFKAYSSLWQASNNQGPKIPNKEIWALGRSAILDKFL